MGVYIALVHHNCLDALGRENLEDELQVCDVHSCPLLQMSQNYCKGMTKTTTYFS